MTFRKVLTFTQTKTDESENDIMKDMSNSIAFMQTSYCHPSPSEYFENLDVKIHPDKLYAEFYITFPSLEVYNQWYDVYGEITEELYLEIQEDYKSLGIVIERFFDNVEASKCYDAQPIERFVTKIS
jgi:hypothetical protein